MRISDLRLDRSGASARASARITFETVSRPPFDLFFETEGEGHDDLSPEPEAFLAACVLPAIHHEERRVRVDGRLCPRLASGVRDAAALLRSWYGPPRDPIEIEASEGFRALEPRSPARAATFLTGGVDSTHLLHTNRRDYPREHPASFADAISLHGHLRAESAESPWNARVLAALRRTADVHGMALVAIRTNLWDLDPDLALVTRESLGASLASAAHLFRSRWTSVSIASGRDITRELPRGTHPLLDPLFASSAVEIRHDPIRLTRFERLRELAGDGGPGARDLIVCLAYPGAGRLNCGECEKCVRTMVQLLALGQLGRTRSFPRHDVTPDMVRGVPINPVEVVYWEEAIPHLARNGRDDLGEVIREKLRQTRRLELWSRESGWKGNLRRLDRRLLGGRLLSLRRRFRRA